VILMVVGVIGFILSLIFWDTWGRGPIGRRARYVEGDVPVRRTVEAAPAARRRVVEEEVEEVPPGAPPPP
jgi:hypothetical protein